MGRLSKRVTGRLVFSSIFILAILFLYLFFAKPKIQTSDFQKYLDQNNLITGSEVIDGYEQIYYVYKAKRNFVTDGQINRDKPAASGRYIVFREFWNGQSQIVRYDLLEKTRLQLSFFSVNSEATVDREGKVTWKGQRENQMLWYRFDGSNVKALP